MGARYPQTDPVTGQPHPNAGQPEWCFAYGEKEWMNGAIFNIVKQRARGDLLAVPPIPPQGRINCTTGVAI